MGSAYVGILLCQRGGYEAEGTVGGGKGVLAGGVARRRGGAAPSSALERLVRKLIRRSKTMMICSATMGPSPSRQYDPQSYARNFDRNGLGIAADDDSAHFGGHTFSSRFASNSVSSSGRKAAAAAAAVRV